MARTWSFTAGGVARLTDTSVSTQGAQMYGVVISTGGATTILGGSISTAGDNANGLYATGAGSSITTSNGRRLRPRAPTTMASKHTWQRRDMRLSGGR